MKNHVRGSGKTLQMNKKWKHLKPAQQEAIAVSLRRKYLALHARTKRVPTKAESDFVLSEVLDELREKEIWIPEREVSAYFSSKKRRWQNQYRKQLPAESDNG